MLQIFRLDLRCNIVGDLKESMGTSSLGMDDSLWDSLSSEVSKLIQEGEVLGQNWTTWTSGERVLVIVNWSTS